MNIEEAIDILQNSIADYVIGEYCEKCADNKICGDRNEDCYYQQAIDIVVTAYEKEKEKREKLEYEAQEAEEYIKSLKEQKLEDLDLTTVYMNGFYDGEKKVKDKIKAKIEVLKKKYNDLYTKHLKDCGIAEQRELAKIEVLQSLLKKE